MCINPPGIMKGINSKEKSLDNDEVIMREKRRECDSSESRNLKKVSQSELMSTFCFIACLYFFT